MIIFIGGLVSAEAGLLGLSTYEKQISWTAANIENPQVARQFQESFKPFMSDKNGFPEIQTSEGQRVFQQGKNLLAVINLQKNLKACHLEQAGALGIRETIANALGVKALQSDICQELTSGAPKVLRFNQELETHFQSEARDQILANARGNLKQTQEYWAGIEKEDTVNLAVSLTERELDSRVPKAGSELLLYTKALKERADKSYISKKDVLKAFAEIKSELKSNSDYLQDSQNETPEKSLRSLVVTNPGAVAQYLIQHPEAVELICRTLQGVDVSMARNEKLEDLFFWGGIAIAGVLIASGVGAVAGVAMVGTLSTVAAGAALAGTVTAVGDTVYSSNKAHDSYLEAQNIRSSSYAEGLSTAEQTRMEEANQKAFADLQGAGISAISIIPFGAGFKVMKSMSQASRLGSLRKVASQGAKVEAESLHSLSVALKEISSDQDLYRALEKARVPEEEMGEFLGLLSGLSPSEKIKVFEAIKAKPEKVAEAMRESSKTGVCK